MSGGILRSVERTIIITIGTAGCVLVQERAPQKLDAFGAHYLFRIRKLQNYCADLQI